MFHEPSLNISLPEENIRDSGILMVYFRLFKGMTKRDEKMIGPSQNRIMEWHVFHIT